jgi:hypothetical protein
MDPAPPPSVGSIFGSVDTSKLLGSNSDEEDPPTAPAVNPSANNQEQTRPPLTANPMAVELSPKIAAAMRVVTRLRPDNPIEVFAGALLGDPEPAPGASGKHDGGVAAFLTANVTVLVTEAMTACLTANPPPADPAAFVAEYLQSSK